MSTKASRTLRLEESKSYTAFRLRLSEKCNTVNPIIFPFLYRMPTSLSVNSESSACESRSNNIYNTSAFSSYSTSTASELRVTISLFAILYVSSSITYVSWRLKTYPEFHNKNFPSNKIELYLSFTNFSTSSTSVSTARLSSALVLISSDEIASYLLAIS